MRPVGYTSVEGATNNFDDDILLPETKLRILLQAGNITLRKGKSQNGEEAVPDSEEDREPQQDFRPKEVIVISSSDEEQEEDEVEAALQVEARNVVLPGSWPSDSEDERLSKVSVNHSFRAPRSGRRLPAARRIIQSSDSENSEPVPPIRPVKKQSAEKPVAEEVIELTSSSEDEIQPRPSSSSNLIRTSQENSSQVNLSLYLTQEDDGAVIIFDEPKSARKPLRVATTKKLSSREHLQDAAAIEKADGPPPTSAIKGRTLRDSPSINLPAFDASASQNTSCRKPNKRISKKALEEAEQSRREDYAKKLFLSLNSSVFKNGLPQETQLTWNKRLLSTAGRAKYRRSRDGIETAEIELATKILDCDERIRNTLSHEMCHLATWVINKKLDENHGKLFKYWASKVTRKRPDIEITTRHNYEISYPYKWQCQKCQKIYGRYSKSIRPDECVCGACREGRLSPLFTVRSKTQTPKISRQAAGTFQDSPCSLPRSAKAPMDLTEIRELTYLSDVDADIEALTLTMDKAHIV